MNELTMTWQELSDSFDKTVTKCDALIARIEANLEKQQKCAGRCGNEDNLPLTEYTGIEAPIYMCRRCVRDMEIEGEL